MARSGVRDVDKALSAAGRGVRRATKELNADAGKSIARGDFARGEELMQTARGLMAFSAEVADLEAKWSSVRESLGPSTEPRKKTPLWAQYVPILRALIELDGEADRATLAAHLKSNAVGEGAPWKVLGRVRRAMIGEGFLDGSTKGRWRITDAGRRAAKSQPISQPGSAGEAQ